MFVDETNNCAMKNVVLYLLFMNFCAFYAQPYKGTLTLKNNKSLTGFIKPDSDNGVLFGSINTELTPVVADSIASYDIHVNGINEYYVFLLAKSTISAKSPPKLRAMKLLKEGSKLNIYEYRMPTILVIALNGAETFELFVQNPDEEEAIFFAARVGDPIDTSGAFIIGGRKYDRYKFKEFATELFRDCPDLVEKIKKKEFKVKQSLEIIEYYNTQCK